MRKKPAKAAQDISTSVADAFEMYHDHPVEFCEDILNCKLYGWQIEAIEAFRDNRKVSIRSGRGIGKTRLVACIVLWLLATFPETVIVVTAPTFNQLRQIIFPEIEKVATKSLIKEMVKCTPTEVRFGDFNHADARTGKSGEALQGYHSTPGIGSMVIIADEASGISQEFFEALGGSLTGKNNYILMTGNPTRTDGYFYNSHNKSRANWYTMKVSSQQSPAVDDGFIQMMKTEYGEDSDAYRVHVLGEFPSMNADSLVPLAWMEDAIITKQSDALEKIAAKGSGFVISVDVARFGADSSVIMVRQGNILYASYIQQFQGLALNVLAGHVVKLYKTLEKKSPKNPNTGEVIKPVVCVDTIGVGAGVFDMLREQGIKAREVVVSETAPDTFPSCHRLRDWLYWQARCFFDPEQDNAPVIYMPDAKAKKYVDRMITELSGLTYRYNSSGAIQVEAKDSYKERNEGRSPDFCDSLCLGFSRSSHVPKKHVIDMWSKKRRSMGGGGGFIV